MRYSKIPDETIRRLPIYLRGLFLASKEGATSLSSTNLSKFIGINPCQIRKDFSYFGYLGVRGSGYNIEKLLKELKSILKITVVQKAALVGVGNLGSAILSFPGFEMYGLNIAAAFDVNPQKIGKKKNNVKIEDVSKLWILKKKKIHLAILAVPTETAQSITNKLVKAGVKGILNFSSCYLSVPKKVKVITTDIAMELARLPYYISAG
ncbi:MAG: redox-sensing transcriptional repressor Rex [Sedimentisphaerales bacterium]|nr:redox-sensing transcriptional repressor Rex [Sedimentisphaerales bacterium]